MSPFFSIVIATYNRADMLRHTIASIQNQTFRDFELIVVDDGSKDDTRSVVLDIAATDNRIRYLYQDNAERAVARNRGHRHAAARYVMFFDSDDLMPPDHLERMRMAINRQPGYRFYAAKFVFDENGVISQPPVSKLPDGPYSLNFVLRGNPIGTLFTVQRDYEGFQPFPEDRTLSAMEDWMCLVKNLVNERLYLTNHNGCIVNNHDGRSMGQNQAVIQKRLKATSVLDREVRLNPAQRKEMWAYTYSFCAVHAYLDRNRGQALGYVWKAIRTGGLRTDFLLLGAKAMVGKGIINKLK